MHPGFRIFVLGAGFSKLAGLPLATELFPLVKASIDRRHGNDTKFNRDVAEYLAYRKAADGVELDPNHIDLEALVSFLDIEHFLELRGSDTWSDEGNESQLMIRRAIGEVIHLRTPAANKLPSSYYRFAEKLSVHDWVLTFNYDIVLERALEHVGKPYRLFPNRFSSIGKHSNTVDSAREDVALLKMHGSIDWFNDKQYKEMRASLGPREPNGTVLHSIFDFPQRYGTHSLVDGPRSPDDPLSNIYRIRQADLYYHGEHGLEAPFILSPSHVKFVYSEPLLSFWRGMGKSGGMNLGINVIGFSLPAHDEYIRIGLYQMISNYQGYSWDTRWFDNNLKDYVRFVDYRATGEGIADYESRYRFSLAEKSRFMFGGFGEEAVEFLFSSAREA